MVPNFAPGHLVGKQYRVIGLLGAGGQGAVYRASDELTPGREVAIKVVKFDPNEREALARTASEYAALSKISHPNIVGVYAAGRLAENQCYMALEFIKGKTLEARIAKTAGAIPFEECLHILRQVALGLEAAHAEQVIHRDLKPANILLTDDGGVKLIDFGLARDMELGQTLTQDGLTIGTSAYMSPEQIMRVVKLDHRTDIYAFGIVAYEMAAGAPPFDGGGHVAIVTEHLTKRIPPIAQQGAPVPRWYQRFVEMCTEFHRDNRFQSFDEVIQTLEEKMLILGMNVPESRVRLTFAGRVLDCLFGSL